MDYGNINLPFGLAAAGLYEERFQLGKRNLTEAEKEEMIFQYKDAQKKAEDKGEPIREPIGESMKGLSSDEDIASLFGGPSIG